MKKLFFSFVMLVTLIIVAGSAKAQTSTTPYPGGTYSYTMTGIDNVSHARTARVFLDNDAIAATPNMAVASKYTVTSSLTVTPAANYYDVALPANTTTLNFSIAYNAAISTGLYQLYVVIYDGDDTKCSNFIYTNITVTANNFDLAVAAPSISICQTINGSPAVDNAASVGQSTSFTYTITKIGGDTNDDWSFDFTIPSNGLGLDIANITARTAAITTGLGTNSVAITGTPNTGTYNVKVTNSDATTDASVITITITVPTTTGIADAAFAATASSPKLYTNQTANVYMTSETNSGNNSATVTLKNLPSIGTFSGN